jgi:S-adenosylmethionine:tRNA ribosyltransferase-isomerase
MTGSRLHTLSDFDFDLPKALIAQHPLPERSASRLLDGRRGSLVDRVFKNLPELLQPNDLLVFNDTQVIKARLRGHKSTGGSVEALVERVLAQHEVLVHLRASKSPKAGSLIWFESPQQAAPFQAEVLGRAGAGDELFHLRFEDEPFSLLERYGHVPLPPYITHADSADDAQRYQTVFAQQPGAVAAPTAALHFDAAVLQALERRGVQLANITLHVGAGTFQPVRTENIQQHKMHSEWFNIPEATCQAIALTRQQGGRIVAVGTTTLRSLESAARSGVLESGSRETDIFITPGFQFQVVDDLVTNFHLPKSTLMMLVSAFAGYAHIMQIYQHAIAQSYRFFSYGDAMILSRTAAS